MLFSRTRFACVADARTLCHLTDSQLFDRCQDLTDAVVEFLNAIAVETSGARVLKSRRRKERNVRVVRRKVEKERTRKVSTSVRPRSIAFILRRIVRSSGFDVTHSCLESPLLAREIRNCNRLTSMYCILSMWMSISL